MRYMKTDPKEDSALTKPFEVKKIHKLKDTKSDEEKSTKRENGLVGPKMAGTSWYLQQGVNETFAKVRE